VKTGLLTVTGSIKLFLYNQFIYKVT